MASTNQRAIAGSVIRPQKHRPDASGSGSTINSDIHHTVTVGTGGYLSPLSITSAGGIDPSQQAYSATGLVLAGLGVVGTITNSGFIAGGYGAYGATGGNGGLAVDLDSTFIFTNKGIIEGGDGGNSGNTGGRGGYAVVIAGMGTFTNAGQIDGGIGGYGATVSGAGGAGMFLNGSAMVINSGTIRGSAGEGASVNTFGASGGAALSAIQEDLIKNTGLILGGDGGLGSSGGGAGARGVYVESGTLINSGTIGGGAGGPGGIFGAAGGIGVYLLKAGTATNTGAIHGGNGASGTNGGSGGAGLYLQSYGTLANSGTITGGTGGMAPEFGGGGGVGLGVFGYSTASNAGIINGGNGAAATSFNGAGGYGGQGVFIKYSSFSNTGKINGGAGGSTPGFKSAQSHGSQGAAGLDAQAGVITNSGIITGGTGGGGLQNSGGTAGTGGLGVYLTASTLTNTGTIIGGTGGTVPPSNYTTADGGIGGAGAVVGAGSTLVNDKLIKGGTGGTNAYVGNTGGAGVIIDGGVFTNAGTVTQGYGGASQSRGANGDAVSFAGAGMLVAAPGAKFVGTVVSSLTSGSVLELTGSSSTPLAGIGSQFIGINLVSFATGATRAVEGSLGNNLTPVGPSAVIAGFAAHDTLVIDGFVANPNYTYVETRFSEIFFSAGGNKYDDVNYSNLLAKDLEVTTGGGKTTLTGLGATATTLASGAAEFVRKGGTATGSINKGAFEEILSGGTVTATTIAGGELNLSVGAKTTGTLSFSGTGGFLDIGSATMPTATIAGFALGDIIRLDGVAYNRNDTVTVGTAGTVTITAPGLSYKLNIAGATKGETDFKFGPLSELTKTAAAKPAMGFIAPQPAAETTAPDWAPAHAPAFAPPAAHDISPGRNGDFVTLAQNPAPLIHGAGWITPQISLSATGLDTALKTHITLP